MRFFLFVILLFLSVPQVSAAETVVLLHGIARTGESLAPITRVLQAEGYSTAPLTYPSTTNNLSGITHYLRQGPLDAAFWERAGIVHFVTHSMGGLVVQDYLNTYRAEIPADKIGRVVMLAPPNGGSEIADLLHHLLPYQWYYGPAGEDLTTASRRGAGVNPFYELGIIAGTKEWPYVVSAFIVPGASDGRVSVEKTKMTGMKDHIRVSATHTFIMSNPDVHRHIIAFLKNGNFSR